MSDRSIWTLVIAILAIIGGFVVCDAVFDDEDEPGDLGAPALVESSRPPDDRDGPARDCDDQACNDHRDCYQSQDYCSDDDQLQVGPICVEDGACRFG